jgi:enoyl-CoA hydratase/carnithine racemase
MSHPEPLHFADGSLQLTFEGELAHLTLNQPARRNALSAAMWQALPAAVKAVADHPTARVLLVRGAGEDFAAGADIAEFDTVFADRAATLRYAQTMTTALDALAACPKPVLAAIQGHCVGAGVAVALACDLRLASSTARFGVTPAKLGLLYSLGDTRRLVRAVGDAKARDLLFTGRLLGADEALAMGLADEVHAAADWEAAVRAKAQLIAAQSAWSVRHAKAVLALIADGTTADTDQTRAWFADAPESEDYRARVRKFRTRRS